jgi:hypothetical protein
MKFILHKTSERYGSVKPCEEAIKIKVPYWHIRTCSEEEYDRRFSKIEKGLWRSYGSEHEITADGYIIRKEDDSEVWGISINSLNELVDFVKKYGDIVLSFPEEHRTMEIEIYDTYRE